MSKTENQADEIIIMALVSLVELPAGPIDLHIVKFSTNMNDFRFTLNQYLCPWKTEFVVVVLCSRVWVQDLRLQFWFALQGRLWRNAWQLELAA